MQKIIALTECHLNPDIINEEMSIEGFTIYRGDRKDRSHEGVIIYSDWSCLQISKLPN